MRSTSSSVNLQKLLRSQFNINVEAEQYTGTYYGVVQQTDFSVAGQANTNAPAPIPRGQMTFTIPSLSPSMVWGPIPYPGVENPPIGTITTITFDNRNLPVAHNYVGWTSSPYGPSSPLSVSSGGTGASTPADAIAEIGAVSASTPVLTGPATFQSSATFNGAVIFNGTVTFPNNNPDPGEVEVRAVMGIY